MPDTMMNQLADFFAALSRIFGDPKVQEKASDFFGALNDATDRELPGMIEGKELGT